VTDHTRPSAIAERLDETTPICDASVVELLNVCLLRAGSARLAAAGFPDAAREYSIAITHIEDAIGRFNKGTYRMDGTFAISDAERSPH
jgi:hypothetical protein